MINIIALVPDTVIDSLREKLEDLPKLQREAIASRVSVTYRKPKGKTAYDILCPTMEHVEAMKEYEWELIGMWDLETGKLLSEFNEALYLEIMPDEIKTEGEVVSRERPTVPRDVNRRAGQAPRQFR